MPTIKELGDDQHSSSDGCSCKMCKIINEHELSTSKDILNAKHYEHIFTSAEYENICIRYKGSTFDNDILLLSKMSNTIDSDYMDYIHKNKKIVLKLNKEILKDFNKDCIHINQSDEEYKKNKTSLINKAYTCPSIKISDGINTEYLENLFRKTRFNFKIDMFPNYSIDMEQSENAKSEAETYITHKNNRYRSNYLIYRYYEKHHNISRRNADLYVNLDPVERAKIEKDNAITKCEIIKLCGEEVTALYGYKDEYMKCNFNINVEDKDEHLDIKLKETLTIINSIGYSTVNDFLAL